MSKEHLAAEVNRLRKAKGYSQPELAEKAGIGERTVLRIETAGVDCHSETLRRLGVALDTSFEHLNSVLNQRSSGITAKTLERHKKARGDQHLYEFLEWYYKLNVHKIGKFRTPLIVYKAPKAQRRDVEAPVHGGFDISIKEEIDSFYEVPGSKYLKELDPTGDLFWNGVIYRMVRLTTEKQLKMNCSLGRYFSAAKTCHVLQWELLEKFARLHPSPTGFERFKEKLPLRNHVEETTPLNPAVGRTAGIAISTALIYRDSQGFKLIIKRRSLDVGIDQGLLDVAPSFMFHPVTGQVEDEFSVMHSFRREYIEECFDQPEMKSAPPELIYDFFYGNHNLLYLHSLLQSGAAHIFFTGISFNLMHLGADIGLALFIEDPEWIVNQSRGLPVGNLQLNRLRFNREWMPDDPATLMSAGNRQLGPVRLGPDFSLPPNYLTLEDFSPSAIAAIQLALETVREHYR